jgi:hypothetical protein
MSNLPTNDAPPTTILNENEYDALADLFLGAGVETKPPLRLHRQDEASHTPAKAPAPAVRSPVEALILGHLPILASPWVPQYALHRAQANHESIGLIRLHASQCSLDIFSTTPLSSPCTASSHLSQAIAQAAPHVGRWLIRVDATDEPTLINTTGVDSLTLLSSTDDAAVVSAYQTIKRFEIGTPSDNQDQSISVVFIGATERESRDASGKIERAVGAFLDTTVNTQQGPTKLGPTNGKNLYRGDAPQDITTLLTILNAPDRIDDFAPAPSSHPATTRIPPRPTRSSRPDTPTTPTLPPTRLKDPQPRTATSPPADRLAVHIPGLKDLGVTCPYATDVSIAFDAQSKLHLLCAHTSSSFQSLQVTRAWAIDHTLLLSTLAEALGFQSANFSTQDPVTLHVFTESLESVRRVLDAPIRFHLLTDVTINNALSRACVALNP